MQTCPFCDETTVAKAVAGNEHVYLVPNIVQYDLWELHDVTDHLLVIPRRHAKTLAELSKAERQAVIDVCAEYEAKGYGIYARGNGSVLRSVTHQHTHLIKTTNKMPRLTIYLRRPYWLIKW